MAETDNTTPHAIERWLERKLPGYRFGLVLLLLLVTCVFMASGITSSWGRVVTVALQGLTLLAALRASQVHRRTFRIAALVALVAFVAAVVSVAITDIGQRYGRDLRAEHLGRGRRADRDRKRPLASTGGRHPHRSRRHLHLRAHGHDVRVPLRGHRLLRH